MNLEAPIGRRDGQIHQAVETFRAGEEAPVIKRSGSVIYPFDESQPVVRCSPLRACDIELQAGEIVTGVALGDTERWLTSPLESGDPDRAEAAITEQMTYLRQLFEEVKDWRQRTASA